MPSYDFVGDTLLTVLFWIIENGYLDALVSMSPPRQMGVLNAAAIANDGRPPDLPTTSNSPEAASAVGLGASTSGDMLSGADNLNRRREYDSMMRSSVATGSARLENEDPVTGGVKRKISATDFETNNCSSAKRVKLSITPSNNNVPNVMRSDSNFGSIVRNFSGATGVGKFDTNGSESSTFRVIAPASGKDSNNDSLNRMQSRSDATLNSLASCSTTRAKHDRCESEESCMCAGVESLIKPINSTDFLSSLRRRSRADLLYEMSTKLGPAISDLSPGTVQGTSMKKKLSVDEGLVEYWSSTRLMQVPCDMNSGVDAQKIAGEDISQMLSIASSYAHVDFVETVRNIVSASDSGLYMFEIRDIVMATKMLPRQCLLYVGARVREIIHDGIYRKTYAMVSGGKFIFLGRQQED